VPPETPEIYPEPGELPGGIIPGASVYYTGDATAIDGDGYVRFSGRADEIIKAA
jgi:acyl-coenzyme A synthetase/AMP-(fatty) acid ligase